MVYTESMGERPVSPRYKGLQIFSLNILEHLKTSQDKLRNILGYIGRSLGGIRGIDINLYFSRGDSPLKKKKRAYNNL